MQEPEAVLQGRGWLSPRALPRRAQSFENNQSRSSRTRGRFRLNQVHRHSLTWSLKPAPLLCQPPVYSRAGRYGTRFDSSQAALSIRSHRGRSTFECPLQYPPWRCQRDAGPSQRGPHRAMLPTQVRRLFRAVSSAGDLFPLCTRAESQTLVPVGAGLTGHGRYRSIYLPVCTTFPSP